MSLPPAKSVTVAVPTNTRVSGDSDKMLVDRLAGEKAVVDEVLNFQMMGDRGLHFLVTDVDPDGGGIITSETSLEISDKKWNPRLEIQRIAELERRIQRLERELELSGE